jgi:hypothetical protein
VLTLVSASGAAAIQLLVWAELGEGVALTVAALALAADVQSAAQPYLPSLKIGLGNAIQNTLPIADPISTDSSSLYWASMPTYNGYSLATYDEILTQKGLFVCLSDQGTSGFLSINSTPVPGSLTSINEDAYKDNYCRYLSVEQGWSDIVSGMDYCKNVKSDRRMRSMLTRIKLALSAWLIASTCEIGIAVVLIRSQLLPLLGVAAVLVAVCIHPLVLLYCLRRRRWAYGTLVLLAPLSLLWWPLGKPFLTQLGGWSFLVAGGFIALRFGALALIRDRTSEAWIESHTCGATFWFARKPVFVLGIRQKLIQLVAAILLGPTLIGYVSGWNRPVVLLCSGMAMFLVVLSIVLARKRES